MSFETFFGSEKFNLFQTITPYKGSKKGLLLYRLMVLIVLSFGLYCSIDSVIHRDQMYRDNWMWFSYFTNQTYVAIMIYFILGVINYFCDANNKLKGKISNSFLHTIVHIFYNILLPLAFIVTTVFWGLIVPWLDTSNYTLIHWTANVIQHFVQFVAAAIDWFLITIPTNYHHFLPMLIVGIAYFIFSQIYHIIYGIWIYGFLDTSKNDYWYVVYIGLVIVWIILGFVFVGIQKFKNKNRKIVDDIDDKDSTYSRKMVVIELA